jgi:hypothetical protein
MGQSVSTPTPHPDVVDFLNLPKEALAALWTSYNLLGEVSVGVYVYGA